MTLNEIFMEENLYKFKSKDEERKSIIIWDWLIVKKLKIMKNYNLF